MISNDPGGPCHCHTCPYKREAEGDPTLTEEGTEGFQGSRLGGRREAARSQARQRREGMASRSEPPAS